ncbi:hypothetical protein SAMN02745724_01739 [Pseudoalteromonas denitrificans DSM 6059]|uniref:Uncharacterized protein n=2 Tax=Pseudoalteromonas TaxID=53246 RepID=A0A1I1JG02_9GAMM|nr:hypothetical protein SAMN02745724_01739 [Pseudoalteromonas denitrificans DSM 6059]
MENKELTPFVLISAITSRLVQLQSTHYTEQSQKLQAPETYRRNAKFLRIAELSCQSLMEKILAGESGLFSIDIIYKDICTEIKDLTRDELKLVIKFLSFDSEFHYLNDNNNEVSTRSLTRLIDYQARSERVKLTQAGRLLHRVLRVQRDWIFEDKEVEKILRAISNAEFSLIPDLIEDVLITFKIHSEEITKIKENASYEELAQNYADKRTQYTETLDLSLQAIEKCLERIDSKNTRDALQKLQSDDPATHITSIYLKQLITDVAAALESLSRNFTSLIKIMQNDKSKRMGILNFKEIANSLVQGNARLNSLKGFITDSFGWTPGSNWFSSLDLEEKLEFIEEDSVDNTVAYEVLHVKDEIQSWVNQHKDYLLKSLASGPKSLISLITDTNQEGLLTEIDHLGELFSLTVSPIQLSDSLEIKLSVFSKDSIELINHHLTLSKIEISLTE